MAIRSLRIGRLSAVLLLPLCMAANAWAWVRIDPEALVVADAAVMRSGQSRTDFACQVDMYRPELGYDLRFHADYYAAIPFKVLEAGGGWFLV